jgi:hypothetical protein
MTAIEKNLTELAKSAADRLSALRSETALQLHLAGMEAKQAWAEVGPEVEALEAKLKEAAEGTATGQARLELHLALMEARDRWRALEPKVAESVGHAADAIKGAFAELGAALDRSPKKGAPS